MDVTDHVGTMISCKVIVAWNLIGYHIISSSEFIGLYFGVDEVKRGHTLLVSISASCFIKREACALMWMKRSAGMH